MGSRDGVVAVKPIGSNLGLRCTGFHFCFPPNLLWGNYHQRRETRPYFVDCGAGCHNFPRNVGSHRRFTPKRGDRDPFHGRSIKPMLLRRSAFTRVNYLPALPSAFWRLEYPVLPVLRSSTGELSGQYLIIDLRWPSASRKAVNLFWVLRNPHAPSQRRGGNGGCKNRTVPSRRMLQFLETKPPVLCTARCHRRSA